MPPPMMSFALHCCHHTGETTPHQASAAAPRPRSLSRSRGANLHGSSAVARTGSPRGPGRGTEGLRLIGEGGRPRLQVGPLLDVIDHHVDVLLHRRAHSINLVLNARHSRVTARGAGARRAALGVVEQTRTAVTVAPGGVRPGRACAGRAAQHVACSRRFLPLARSGHSALQTRQVLVLVSAATTRIAFPRALLAHCAALARDVPVSKNVK
jgi:hypothetical protein